MRNKLMMLDVVLWLGLLAWALIDPAIGGRVLMVVLTIGMMILLYCVANLRIRSPLKTKSETHIKETKEDNGYDN